MANKVAELWLKIKSTGEEKVEQIGKAFEKLSEVAAGVFAGLSAVLIKSVAEFQQGEEATNALTQAMVNNGIYSRELAQRYKEQADALARVSTFSDDQITSAQAALQQQIGQIEITKELTQSIMDFATAQKMDLASAAEVVGKSIGTSTNALTRYGIEVNASASSADKMAQVIDGLNGKFGGQAAAATNGMGALKLLVNTFNELFEEIGARVAPIVILFANHLTKLAGDATNAGSTVETLVTIFNFASKVASTLANMIAFLGDTIGIGLGTAVAATEAAMAGRFGSIKEIVANGYDGIKEAGVQRTQAAADAMAAIDQAAADNKALLLAKEENDLRTSLQRKQEIKTQAAQQELVTDMEAKIAKKEQDIAFDTATEEEKLALQIQWNEEKLRAETDKEEKLKLLREKYDLLDKKAKLDKDKFNEELDKKTLADRQATFSKIATLQTSNNQTLASIGKAAALTQIAIDTPVAVGRALSAFPPPFNYAAAGLVGAAMAAQAAKVAGIPLAEGGIVKARPGGIQATIGEGGQDEAVIPLDRAGEFGMGGGGITIIVNGGLLGDEASAYELARAVDRNLLKLRQNGESVAFDSGVS